MTLWVFLEMIRGFSKQHCRCHDLKLTQIHLRLPQAHGQLSRC